MLRTERQASVLHVTLDRPEAGNALDAVTIAALRGTLDEAAADSSLRCLVLAGRGRFFCAGGDLKAYRALSTPAALEEVFGAARALLDAIEAMPIPVIAVVDGYAIGGGAELAMACDLRIAGPRARLGFPQLKLGIIPGWDGTERLTALVERGAAMKLLLTGEILRADAAVQLGLVDVAAEDALVAADEITAALDRAAPLSIRGWKEAMTALRTKPRGEARGIAADVFSRLWLTEDHREAEAAFAEKREPVFHGR